MVKDGSPKAKVCWPPIEDNECFDAWIHYGVDVLSPFYIGRSHIMCILLYTDVLAIGTFHAVKNGITVICAAGKFWMTLQQDRSSTVSKSAPCIITIGAKYLEQHKFEGINCLTLMDSASRY